MGYLAHGTATDYMYDVLKIPLAMTWEIYGDPAADYNDCFAMFNPTSAGMLDAVLTQWTRSLLQLLELLPYHPSLPGYNGKPLEEYRSAVTGWEPPPGAAVPAEQPQPLPQRPPEQQASGVRQPLQSPPGTDLTPADAVVAGGSSSVDRTIIHSAHGAGKAGVMGWRAHDQALLFVVAAAGMIGVVSVARRKIAALGVRRW